MPDVGMAREAKEDEIAFWPNKMSSRELSEKIIRIRMVGGGILCGRTWLDNSLNIVQYVKTEPRTAKSAVKNYEIKSFLHTAIRSSAVFFRCVGYYSHITDHLSTFLANEVNIR